MQSPYFSGWIFAGIAVLMWGFLGPAFKLAFLFCDPGTISWFRMVFSFLFLLVFLFIQNKNSLNILVKPPWQAVLAGIFLGLNYLFFAFGVKAGGAGTAQLVIQMGPVMLSLVGILWFKERFVRAQFTGLIILIFGYILFWNKKFSFPSPGMDPAMGAFWVFLSALAWVGWALCSRYLKGRFTSSQINLIVYLTASILLIAWASPESLHNLSLSQSMILLFLGLNTVIAYGAMAEALFRIPSNHAGMISSMTPAITFMILSLMFHFQIPVDIAESISTQEWMGAIMVMAGICLTVGMSSRDQKSDANS